MISGIYKITNLINNKFYIGSAIMQIIQNKIWKIINSNNEFQTVKQ